MDAGTSGRGSGEAVMPQDTSCWCTTPGNKRHNASCRCYRTAKGHPCGKSEGTPCRKCGG
jgi:hypothetical protein